MCLDQRALLNGIIAEPERDDLRLIYCDWLEENEETITCPKCNGDGEFKWQVSGPIYGHDMCRHCGGENNHQFYRKGSGRVSNGMKERADRIRWQCDHPREHLHTDFPDQRSVTAIYNRGFIAEVRCTMAEWPQHGPAICSEHPVERVVITDKEPQFVPEPTRFVHESRKWVWMVGTGHQSDANIAVLPIMFYKKPRDRMYYDSITEANDWLSARSIAWARERAATTSAS